MSDDPQLANGSRYAAVPLVIALLVLVAGGAWMLGRGRGVAERNRSLAEAGQRMDAETKAAYEKGFAAGEASRQAVPTAAPEVAPAPPTPAPAAVEAPAAPAVPEPERPTLLQVRTVPLAEVLVAGEQGEFRSAGRADSVGDLSLEAMPAGVYRLEVRHPDYPKMEAPVRVELASGTTARAVVAPPPPPAALMIFADDAAPLYLDGKKVGQGGTALLGKVPSRRDLLVTLGEPGKETRRVMVRLEPRETRALDLRTAGALADKASREKAAAEAALNAPTPGALGVRVVSSDPDTGVVAFARAGGGDAPMSVGNEGRFRAPGSTLSVKVKCVRVFAGVSVCRGEVFDVVGTATKGELVP